MKIHLIGHSFGSICIMELLKDPEINSLIHKAYLLFPAIDHVGSSPNGKLTTRIFRRYAVMNFFIQIFHFFPRKFKYFCISMFCWLASINQDQVQAILLNMKPRVMFKTFFLLNDICKIEELDVETIKLNVTKMKFYFAIKGNDGWSWEKNCNLLKQLVPEADALIDDRNMWHAFQLKSSAEMAKITSEWISKCRP